MTTKNFTLTLFSNQSPKEVFDIIKDVRQWWIGLYSEEISGNTDKLHEEFTYRAGGGLHFSKHRLIEIIPDKKIVWLTTESNLSFLNRKEEWTGTKLIFDISGEKGTTKVTFTHEGLVPEIECYNSCAPVWTDYLKNKLLPLIFKKQTN